LPQPEAGDGIVHCEHLKFTRTIKGTVYFLGDHAAAQAAGGEVPHKWLIVCPLCYRRKIADPYAAIAGFQHEWPAGAVLIYETPS
jgi:hypothetical protein